MGTVEKIFQEEGSVGIKDQRQEQAHDFCFGGKQAGQSGWIMERCMKKGRDKK